MKKRVGILTGGGDVQALNTVIASAKETATLSKIKLLGFIKGWEGAIKGTFIELSNFPINPEIGGTVLKSSRVELGKIENGTKKVLFNLKKNNISGLIVIGGDDTLANSFLIKEFPQILISKTIDNDVGKIVNLQDKFNLENIINYFTLGFPTAADKIVSFVSLREGLRTTAYSHERIIVVESMGMHTGWLALVSGMGHPDFIVIPEFPLDYDSFLEKAVKKYEYQKHLIIVVAEGSKWSDGSYIYAEKDETEDFKHPRFSGASQALKDRLKKDAAKYFNTRNINAVNPSYLYRSGLPVPLDRLWAQKLGKTAVELLAKEIDGSHFLSIQRDKSDFKIQNYPLSQFNSMDELHRFVDERFYDPQALELSENGKKYFREIIREIPLYESYGIRRN